MRIFARPASRTKVDVPEPHEAGPVDSKNLQNVCDLFVTGVTVITSGTDGSAVGTTVSSFTTVSLEPPLILFCLHKESRMREVLYEAGMFAVNFLASRQERVAWAFAGKDTAEIEDVAHHWSADGMPILTEALGFLACRLVNELEAGAHMVFLGEVIEMGLPRQKWEPLIFFRGSMGGLEEEPPDGYPIWDG